LLRHRHGVCHFSPPLQLQAIHLLKSYRSAWEFESFALRAAGTKNQQSVPIAFVSQFLVLLAPMWINAFDYMVMGRMIYFFIPDQKVFGIKGIKIAKIFVWLDIASFLVQVTG
jgi:hypothetical protein